MSSDDFPAAGLLSHRPEDIARALEALHRRQLPLTGPLGDGQFRTRLLFVDPARHYIVIAAPEEAQCRAALARPSLHLFAESGGWHFEFSADDPQHTSLAGTAAIRLSFPAALASQQQRRLEPRVAVPRPAALHCEADGAGYAPFDGELVDISLSGIGFLVYGSAITLEPGTVLRGSRIDRPGRPPLEVDLEVRYTTPLAPAGGQGANRSGCVFLNPTREVAELIDYFNRSETE